MGVASTCASIALCLFLFVQSQWLLGVLRDEDAVKITSSERAIAKLRKLELARLNPDRAPAMMSVPGGALFDVREALMNRIDPIRGRRAAVLVGALSSLSLLLLLKGNRSAFVDVLMAMAIVIVWYALIHGSRSWLHGRPITRTVRAALFAIVSMFVVYFGTRYILGFTLTPTILDLTLILSFSLVVVIVSTVGNRSVESQ